MVVFKIFLTLAIFGVGTLCLYKNKEWATVMRKYYIRESKKHWHGSFFPWEASWTIILFRAIFIGVGIIFLIAAYPAVFGPIHFEF